MLVKLHKKNAKGQDLYQNALTGDHGILTNHLKKAQPSARSSIRADRFKAPLIGVANNNRKRTNGRKIHVYPLIKQLSFKVNETELFIKGKSHIMKEHFRDVIRPTSKRIITVPQ